MKKKNMICCLILAVAVLGAGAVVAHEIVTSKQAEWLSAARKTKPGSPKTVVATVEGEAIYQETIDAAVIAKEIEQENAGQTKAVDAKDVLKDQIRKTVIWQQAVKLGLEADYEDAKAEIEEAYHVVMEENGKNADFLKKYMKAMQFTEEEYLKAAAKVRQYSLTRGNLYLHVTEDMRGTEEEKRSAYEKYVDDLIAKADIRISEK